MNLETINKNYNEALDQLDAELEAAKPTMATMSPLAAVMALKAGQDMSSPEWDAAYANYEFKSAALRAEYEKQVAEENARLAAEREAAKCKRCHGTGYLPEYSFNGGCCYACDGYGIRIK